MMTKKQIKKVLKKLGKQRDKEDYYLYNGELTLYNPEKIKQLDTAIGVLEQVLYYDKKEGNWNYIKREILN